MTLGEARRGAPASGFGASRIRAAVFRSCALDRVKPAVGQIEVDEKARRACSLRSQCSAGTAGCRDELRGGVRRARDRPRGLRARGEVRRRRDVRPVGEARAHRARRGGHARLFAPWMSQRSCTSPTSTPRGSRSQARTRRARWRVSIPPAPVATCSCTCRRPARSSIAGRRTGRSFRPTRTGPRSSIRTFRATRRTNASGTRWRMSAVSTRTIRAPRGRSEPPR